MNKSAYLTAMNVTTWRVRDTKVKPYLVIWDENGELPEAEPLIDAVLKLIDVKRENDLTVSPIRVNRLLGFAPP